MLMAVSYSSSGVRVVKRAKEVLLKGGSVLDAVEEGIKATEDDNSNRSVGIGGLPNFEGEVELDAAIMEGSTLRAGSVAAVKRVRHPISLARKVMEVTPHVMIVGDGALKLARALGLEELDLPLREVYEEYLKMKSDLIKKIKEKRDIPVTIQKIYQIYANQCHDTIGVIVVKDRKFSAGLSTSGLPLKFPGRVGDSPIIGAGLYADDEVGAVICTGFGEIAVRLAAAKSVIDLMRQGHTPQEATDELIRRVNEISKREGVFYNLGIVAVNKDLDIGATANHGFDYVYWRSDMGDDIVINKANVIEFKLALVKK